MFQNYHITELNAEVNISLRDIVLHFTEQEHSYISLYS